MQRICCNRCDVKRRCGKCICRGIAEKQTESMMKGNKTDVGEKNANKASITVA